MARHSRFGARTNARSQALQLLFQAEATNRMVVDVLAGDYALSDGPLDSFAEQLAVGADSMIHQLDAVLEMTSANWGVRRMPAVDRNLLRLAVYEMLQVDDVDLPITIDECVELAKAYGTDESSRFVNGVLGKVARMIEQGDDVVALAVAQLPKEEEPQDETAYEDEPYGDSDGYEPYQGSDDYGFDDAEDEAAEDEPAVEEPAEQPEPAPQTEPLPADDLPAWARED